MRLQTSGRSTETTIYMYYRRLYSAVLPIRHLHTACVAAGVDLNIIYTSSMKESHLYMVAAGPGRQRESTAARR